MTDPQPTRPADDVQAAASLQKEFAHALLFTGHMIDAPDRREARFPAWAEGRARDAIHAAIAALQWTQSGTTVGLAGGASGGDLLFHECCEELGIPTRVLLALAPQEFQATSVAPAGADWVARFRKRLEKAGDQLHVMQRSEGLAEGATDNVWERANLWMIEQAERLAPQRALLALWDGKTGDGPGGTEHFLEVARAHGIRILPPIEMRALLQGAGRSR
jgi:hypothetical protein